MWEAITVLSLFNPATVQLERVIRAALLKGHTSAMGKEGDAYMNFFGALQCAFSCKANLDESYVKKLHTAQNHNSLRLSPSSWQTKTECQLENAAVVIAIYPTDARML